MPTYIDIHDLGKTTADDLAKAHAADLEKQGEYGVNYLKYWVNESCGKAFCLVHAPDAETARRIHEEAHGLVAEKIIEVQPEIAEGFLGGGEVSAVGAALDSGDANAGPDTAIRTVIFTDIVGSTNLTQRLGDEAAMEFVELLQVRIGGAAGEPVDQRNDIFGTTVQLAARLCAHAEPEQILVSNVVAELCIGKGLSFRSLGEVSLKGFDRSVHVQAVEWTGGTDHPSGCSH